MKAKKPKREFMKPRTVIVLLELETDLTIKELRDKDAWQETVELYAPAVDTNTIVRQITVQVAQPAKADAKRKKG